MRRILVVLLMVLCGAVRANAWGGRGHELVAYIAYMNLDPQVRAKVDLLVQQNPCIAEWQTKVKALPVAEQSAALFMLAATWPDEIKLAAPLSKTPYDCPGHPVFNERDGAAGPDGHFSADNPPAGPEASQNIGYTDDRRHKYWHFIDTPISTDGTATQPAPAPNVLTELELLTKALGSDEDIKLRSYDMVWVEHLTGDIHQPLHVAERYSKALPNGDAGGNLVALCSGQAACRAELHAYWDDLPGSDSSLAATIAMGAKLNKLAAPSVATIDVDHPEDWAAATEAIAKADAYAAPFNTGAKSVDPTMIPAAYHTQAMADMQKQISIAGWRLATILENDLKGWSGT